MSTTSTYVKTVVLTSAQFAALETAGTLEEGVRYEINDASVVTDATIDNTSIVSGGVAAIPTSAPTQYGVVKTWIGTKAQYDAITTKDSTVFYFIKEE